MEAVTLSRSRLHSWYIGPIAVNCHAAATDGLDPPLKPLCNPPSKTRRYRPKYVECLSLAAKVMALRCGVRMPTERGPPMIPERCSEEGEKESEPIASRTRFTIAKPCSSGSGMRD